MLLRRSKSGLIETLDSGAARPAAWPNRFLCVRSLSVRIRSENTPPIETGLLQSTSRPIRGGNARPDELVCMDIDSSLREVDSNHRSRSCERSLGCCRKEIPDR